MTRTTDRRWPTHRVKARRRRERWLYLRRKARTGGRP